MIERAERGEEVIIARGDKPAVRVEPFAAEQGQKRQPGSFKGQIAIHDSFWEPMREDELVLWEGGHQEPIKAPYGEPV